MTIENYIIDMNRKIVFVHGLGLWGLEFFLMKIYFARLGYQTLSVSYSVWSKTSEQCIEEICKQLPTDNEPLIFVAHSLGGVMIANLVAKYPALNIHEVIAIATPFNRSKIADFILKIPIVNLIIGKCYKTLQFNTSSLKQIERLGVIYGQLNLLLGYLFRLDSPNDSIVAKSEVVTPETIHVTGYYLSHMSLLFSQKVVMDINYFIEHGKFINEVV